MMQAPITHGKDGGRLLLLLVLPALLLVSALGARQAEAEHLKVNWQTSVDATPEGLVVGLRDKMGDMPRDYRVSFQLLTPTARKYAAHRQVRAGSDEWVEVVFPRDFNAPAAELQPGAYTCTTLVDRVPIVEERFTLVVSGNQRKIQNRRSLYLKPPGKGRQ